MGPEFNLVQDCSAGSFETAPTVAILIPGLFCTTDLAESFRVGYRKESVQALLLGANENRYNLGPMTRGHFACRNVEWVTHHLFQHSYVNGSLPFFLLSSLALRGAHDVMNKLRIGRSSLAFLPGAGECLEHDR